ncbi:2149_t:CDS:2 [Funneliformis caledonium]|uniref:2149_t:CDS:1 n=1 Tax=Funneliformis caledonium TaxID=1117310 RepID=A0A9N9BM69_9GLOM|nr:2149_t:CDS:2 [Funneliformis caledonium]
MSRELMRVIRAIGRRKIFEWFINVRTLFIKEVGTSVNKQKAFELYQKAVKFRNQVNLAIIYIRKDMELIKFVIINDVDKDIYRAIYWYKNHRTGQYSLIRMFRNGGDWYRKSDEEYHQTQYKLAQMNGDGIKSLSNNAQYNLVENQDAKYKLADETDGIKDIQMD